MRQHRSARKGALRARSRAWIHLASHWLRVCPFSRNTREAAGLSNEHIVLPAITRQRQTCMPTHIGPQAVHMGERGRPVMKELGCTLWTASCCSVRFFHRFRLPPPADLGAAAGATSPARRLHSPQLPFPPAPPPPPPPGANPAPLVRCGYGKRT